MTVILSVSEIRSKGKNAANRYNIPDEHSFSEEIILEQLQIIDTLYPPVPSSDVAEKRNAADDHSCFTAKRKKVDVEVNSKCIASQASTSTHTTSNDKAELMDDTTKQPVSRIDLKESIKRAFEASKDKKLTHLPSVTSTTQQSTASSSKIAKDIHQYIAVVKPKGQMQKKLERAAPYNFFLTTITDSKPTHNEPLSITFQGE